MRIEQTRQQKLKSIIHGVQALIIFITGCLSLAVLTKSGGASGTTGFMFGLCFLSVIPLAYLVMVPIWTRSWKLANVYAYATLDILFAILWFAAFVAVAAWTNYGKTHPPSSDSETSKSGKGCGNFAFGSRSKCHTSEASVGFAVVLFVLWCGTSYLSMKDVFEYKRTGIMPNGNSKIHGKAEQLRQDDQDKDTWNTNMEDPHDSDDPQHGSHPFRDTSGDDRLGYGQASLSSQQEYAEQGAHLLRDPHSRECTSTPHLDTTAGAPLEIPSPHPGRPLSYGSDAGGLRVIPPPAYDPAVAPSALSPSDYEQTPGGRVTLPSGSYADAFK